MPIDQLSHPPLDRLTSFALGKLEVAEIDDIAGHLAGCDSCCQTLKQIHEDTFTGAVRDCRQAEPGQAGPMSLGEAPTVAPSSGSQELPAAAAASATAYRAAGTQQPSQLPPELAQHPRYRIQEVLGAGGMGAVYKAEHRLMHRTVALKVINPELVASKTAVERFQREVQAAARLHHPNIVTAHDAEQAGDVHFLVMEYVKGTDLSKVLAERGPLPVAEACNYIRQAALGLQHAMENGMVHRDVKPQNLMVTPTGQVKILDFGLASLAADPDTIQDNQESKLENQKSGLTQAGALMGTPDYMAPEQARDARAADIRADIYSLGCTFYCLLTGKVPFPGGSAIDKVISHAERKPAAVAELRKDLPGGLVQVLDKMMAKAPAERYQTPAEVAAALLPFTTVGPAARHRPPRRRVAMLIAAAAVLLLAGVIYITTDNGQLKIDCKVDDVQVVISKGGKEYEVIDVKSGTTVKRLPSGEYTITLKGNQTDVKLDKGGFTMTRWGQVVVGVTRDDNQAKRAANDRELKIDAAVKAAEAWLKLVNQGQYAQSWEQSSKTNREGVTKQDLVNIYKDLFGKLGKLDSRTILSRRFTTSLPGAADGGFVVIQFETIYKNLKVIETVTAVLEKDGQWRVGGFQLSARSNPAAIDAAVRVADAWLKLKDQQQYAQCWEQSSALSKKSVSKDDVVKLQKDLLKKMGKPESRTIISKQFTTSLPGGPAAEYVVIQYQARYTILKDTMETVIPILEKDGQWRIAGYHFAPGKHPEAERAANDKDLLQGVWRVIDAQEGGDPGKPEMFKEVVKMTLTFQGNRAQLKTVFLDSQMAKLVKPAEMSKLNGEGSVRLDTAINPKRISILTSKKDGHDGHGFMRGIYRLDGDELRICHYSDEEGQDYPTAFATKRGDRARLMILKREFPLERELALVVRAGRDKLSKEEKQQLLADNDPLIGQLADPPTKKIIELFAKLPDDAHKHLLKEEYLKWKFTSLDAARQKVYRDALKVNIDMAKKQGGQVPASMSLEALQKADVGFAVLSIPEPAQRVVSWYILLPEHPQPIWVTVVGARAAAKQPYFDAHLQQLPKLRTKPYSRDLKELDEAESKKVGDIRRSDKKLIQGAWKAVAAEVSGQLVPREVLDAMKPTITFAAEEVKAKPNPVVPKPFLDVMAKQGLLPKEFAAILEKGLEGVYDLDPTKTPKTINIAYLGPVRKTMLGIYTLEGDTLKLCMTVDPQKVNERPTEFATKASVLRGMVTLKRMLGAELPDSPRGAFTMSPGVAGTYKITKDEIEFTDEAGPFRERDRTILLSRAWDKQKAPTRKENK